HCGRGPGHLTQRVLAEHLEVLAGLDHVSLAGFVQAEHLAVIGPRRRGEAAGTGAFTRVDGLAGLGFVAADHAAALQDVEKALIDERRSVTGPGLGTGPGNAVIAAGAFLERNVTGGAGLDGEKRAGADAHPAFVAARAAATTAEAAAAATSGAANVKEFRVA